MQFDKIYTGQKQNYISKVNTQESNPLYPSFPWIKLMGFDNKESFTQKAAQVYKYINSIPSCDELKNGKELQKKFISSLEPDLIDEMNMQLNQIMLDVTRSTMSPPPIFGKLLIYCFVVNTDKKATYTQGDNLQLLALLKSVQTIFDKEAEAVLVTAYLYIQIFKKIIKNFTGVEHTSKRIPTFLRWCILTFGLSKNKKLLIKIDNQKIIELFEIFVKIPNQLFLKDAEENYPIIGNTDTFNTHQILRIYGHILMFEDIISLITYFITIFIQNNTLSELFNKIPDINTMEVQMEVLKWFSIKQEANNPNLTKLGTMGSIYSETFDYDIYLKIYQYLTNPAENIRFSGDKEDRVPYIYTLYKQFTSELSNFESEGVKVYKKISIFNEKKNREDGEEEDEEDEEDEEEEEEHQAGTKGDGGEEEENKRRNFLMKGGAKNNKPLHAMNIRELSILASKFKNIKNPYVKKKQKNNTICNKNKKHKKNTKKTQKKHKKNTKKNTKKNLKLR